MLAKLSKTIKTHWTAIFLSTLLILLGVQYFRTWGYFMEDGFILLRYADNILSGHGWVFNIGEHFNSATSPLQVLVYVLQGALLGQEQLELIAYANLYLWLGVFSIAFYSFLSRQNRALAAGTTLMLVLSPHFYLTFGLESMMNMALLMLTLLSYQRGRETWLMILLSLLILTRLENGLFAGLLLIFLWLRDGIPLRKICKQGILIALPLLAWLLFSSITFGKLLPDSLAAKLWQGSSTIWGIGHIYLKSLLAYLSFYALPFARFLEVPTVAWTAMSPSDILVSVTEHAWFGILLALHAAIALWGLIRVDLKPAQKGTHLLILWAFIHTFLYGILFNVPGYHWYFSLALVSAVVLFFQGLNQLNQRKKGPLLTSVLFTVLFIPYVWVFAIPTQETIIEDKRMIGYRQLAEWIQINTPDNATIIHDEVGALAYLSQRHTIDGVGLTSPQYLQDLREGRARVFWIPSLDERGPSYFVTHHHDPPPQLEEQGYHAELVYESEDGVPIQLYAINKLTPF